MKRQLRWTIASPQYPARWYRDGDAGDSVHLGDLGPRPSTTDDEVAVRSTLEVATATQRLANLEADVRLLEPGVCTWYPACTLH